MLLQPQRLKWQVIPKDPFASCCGLLFWPSSRSLCPAHRSIELLWFAGAFLVLEECPVSAAVEWVLVMCPNTEIGVSYVCSYVYVLFLRKVNL
jgi:hypothetical protein